MYTKKALERILLSVSKKKVSPGAAFQKLKNLPYESLPFAHLDHHRVIRKNIPEVVYGEGKTIEQLKLLIKSFEKTGSPLIITRLNEKSARSLKRSFKKLKYFSLGCLAYLNPAQRNHRTVEVAIVTAGTSDQKVAEEASVTLQCLGHGVKMFRDLGVAGLHRLMDHLEDIEKIDVIICIAGMEGALPSVLAGLVSKPIIAVPTSVGYGAGFGGIAPLLNMLNSCAQGIAVVNIDSGFNAACFAHLILAKRDSL